MSTRSGCSSSLARRRAPAKQAMHRKGYEYTHYLRLSRLGSLRPGAHVLGFGAGHECVLSVSRITCGSSSHGSVRGRWQPAVRRKRRACPDEARRLRPFPFPPERLKFLKMDGRSLGFADETFDVVYSLSSASTSAGGWCAALGAGHGARLRPVASRPRDGVVAAGRRAPGGVRAGGGPPAGRRAGLTLVQPIDEAVWSRYEGAPSTWSGPARDAAHLGAGTTGGLRS